MVGLAVIMTVRSYIGSDTDPSPSELPSDVEISADEYAEDGSLNDRQCSNTVFLGFRLEPAISVALGDCVSTC